MRGVTAGPGPFHSVTLSQVVQFVPQVLVDDGLLIRCHPAAPLPVVDPGCNTVLEIFRIGDHLDLTRLFERAQPPDGGGQLHAVVGGAGLTAVAFTRPGLVSQDVSPTSGTWIADAGSISDQ